MDNYIVSARKYRPATFHSVVGQKSLTTTLKNAIRNNKLAHAYLFCGPRGVGKTTCARIFAKTINCFRPASDGEACNECESCLSFNEGRSLNIHELDAASNNSVDDIRSLTEQVRIPPQIGKYKVYIIDEVHMLSSAAFNAFLKTLEEPPRHAIFILATTEKHKILPTILSRCQIYDFNRIHINDIVEYLEYVASRESVSVEKEALTVIAQKADGGMRDALSIFDQVVSFSQGNVTYETVIDNLNVLDYEYYFRLTDAILNNDVRQSLLLLNEILGKGFDGQQILTGLAVFFRDLLVCKDSQTIVLFEVGDAIKDKYVQLAAKCDVQFLYKAIELTNETDLDYRYSRNKRLSIELLLIRLCQLNSSAGSPEDKKKILIEPIVFEESNTSIANSDSHPEKSPTKSTESPLTKVPLRVSLKKPVADEESKTSQESRQEKFEDKSFSQNDLQKVWKVYSETIDDAYFKSCISYATPLLKENFVVEIAALNPEQERKYKERENEIKQFLSQNLQNNQIKISIEIKAENPSETLFTDKEKYNYLAEKNPNLKLLVEEFNLRLD